MRPGDIITWIYKERGPKSTGHVVIALSDAIEQINATGETTVQILIGDASQEAGGIAIRLFSDWQLDTRGNVVALRQCYGSESQLLPISLAIGRMMGEHRSIPRVGDLGGMARTGCGRKIGQQSQSKWPRCILGFAAQEALIDRLPQATTVSVGWRRKISRSLGIILTN